MSTGTHQDKSLHIVILMGRWQVIQRVAGHRATSEEIIAALRYVKELNLKRAAETPIEQKRWRK